MYRLHYKVLRIPPQVGCSSGRMLKQEYILIINPRFNYPFICNLRNSSAASTLCLSMSQSVIPKSYVLTAWEVLIKYYIHKTAL